MMLVITLWADYSCTTKVFAGTLGLTLCVRGCHFFLEKSRNQDKSEETLGESRKSGLHVGTWDFSFVSCFHILGEFAVTITACV